MSDHTYRVIEIVGSSPDSVDAAIRNAVYRAAETMRGLDWFEVQSVRGQLENGIIAHFQVTLKVGFRLGRLVDRQGLARSGQLWKRRPERSFIRPMMNSSPSKKKPKLRF